MKEKKPKPLSPQSSVLSPQQSSVLSPQQSSVLSPVKGRGASWNPQNRFEKLEYVRDDDAPVDEDAPKTIYLRDPIRSVIAHNDSPDVGFTYSINPYRGCEHGCIYCYARQTHEFFGLNAGLDFETKIFAKEKAPELLREFLSRTSWKPEPIAMAGATDCYEPAGGCF